MQSKKLSAINTGALHDVKLHARISERIKRLVVDLESEFSAPDVKKQLCVDFCPLEDTTVLATISSPVGLGRLLSGWAVDGDELVGLVIVQRSICNEHDATIWQTVWDLKVPAYDPIYSGGDDQREDVFPPHRFGNDYSTAVFRVCLAIMYAIVDGPQFE